ncbi:MAG: Hsp70 family protein, partial [Planctomycetota bacterium]
DAEKHAAEDEARIEVIETRNRADSLTYQIDKLLKEHGDKLPDDKKADLEAKNAELRKLVEEQSEDLATLKAKLEEVEELSQEIGKAMYADHGGDPDDISKMAEEFGARMGGAPGAGPGPGPQAQAQDAGPSGAEDIVDADYEVKS